MTDNNLPGSRLELLKLKADSLVVFRDIKRDPAFGALLEMLEAPSVASYCSFVSSIYPVTDNLSLYIRRLVLQDDNFYVKAVAAGSDRNDYAAAAVSSELAILEEIAAITPGEICSAIGGRASIHGQGISLPLWRNETLDLAGDLSSKLDNIASTGYGIYARYTFFRVADKEIIPVAHPDFQRLDQLFGYERERELIIKNTEALVSGEGASNMLLYGDMGTGKSSTIKAVAAAYADRGLRIIEVKKEQLFQIPDILEELSANPLKFILFIDDLSFSSNDDNFSALKATLEGGVAGCSKNVVIYATSNRRHLVKESFSDRDGDDLHVNDTIQETASLAARFGLTITFMRPEQKAYLDIVRGLAREYGIAVCQEEDMAAGRAPADAISDRQLCIKAEAFAIRRSGRSPRTARQFIELLKIGI